ncbi:MAG: hypothetical protein AAF938_13720 [Myxococcota bacterium]
MWFPALAALVVGALAPVFHADAWGVPLKLLSWRMTLRATLVAGVTTFLAASIALVALPPREAAFVGLLVGGSLTLLAARRMRHERGTLLLAYRVRQPPSRDDATKAMRERFERLAKELDARTYTRLCSIAVLPMSAVGAWDESLAILEGIELEELEGDERARHAQALATCLTERGDLEGAASVLEKIDRPASDAIERWLVALEALLFAIQGASDKALELARQHDDGDGALGASYAIVRAHACACDGRDAEALKALERAREIAGHDALFRAVRPVGPATDLARELLTEVGYGERIAPSED